MARADLEKLLPVLGYATGGTLALYTGLPPAPGGGGLSWAEVEASGATGVAALNLVIASLRPMPLVEELSVAPGQMVQPPGWAEPYREPGVLRVVYRAPDAYDSAGGGRVRQQRWLVTLPADGPFGEPACGPRAWAAWLLWVLTYLAAHEVAEFFVAGGERLFDPHAAGAWLVVDLPPPPWALRWSDG